MYFLVTITLGFGGLVKVGFGLGVYGRGIQVRVGAGFGVELLPSLLAVIINLPVLGSV